MFQYAVFIRHKTLPGRRDQVRQIWEKHMAPAVSANSDHTAYCYCFDKADPDAICAFQQYASAEAAREFLCTSRYLAYVQEVEPLLAVSPQVIELLPVWTKDLQKML